MDLPTGEDDLLAIVLRDDRVTLVDGDARKRAELDHLLGQVECSLVRERVRLNVVQPGGEEHRLALVERKAKVALRDGHDRSVRAVSSRRAR